MKICKFHVYIYIGIFQYSIMTEEDNKTDGDKTDEENKETDEE